MPQRDFKVLASLADFRGGILRREKLPRISASIARSFSWARGYPRKDFGVRKGLADFRSACTEFFKGLRISAALARSFSRARGYPRKDFGVRTGVADFRSACTEFFKGPRISAEHSWGLQMPVISASPAVPGRSPVSGRPLRPRGGRKMCSPGCRERVRERPEPWVGNPPPGSQPERLQDPEVPFNSAFVRALQARISLFATQGSDRSKTSSLHPGLTSSRPSGPPDLLHESYDRPAVLTSGRSFDYDQSQARHLGQAPERKPQWHRRAMGRDLAGQLEGSRRRPSRPAGPAPAGEAFALTMHPPLVFVIARRAGDVHRPFGRELS